MHPHEPTPVKLFCGVLYSDEARYRQALTQLSARYGAVDWQSPTFDFTQTDYYVPEMGAPIFRLFVTFANLIDPKELAAAKIACNAIEERVADAGHRKVNLDPGYLDYDKVVLASAKYAGHKVYLDFGIYADITLWYRKGRFHPSDWCFPDFKTGRYEPIFLHMRADYKRQLRDAASALPVHPQGVE